ncbi:NfeD family protein [Cryobacterium melibiosiphilum]|uniref:NfeD family protein n=1 Tax=Cryobacterium melibiosiphilum TaxID=995039 RepID=A0A3A5MQ28_9MICO|nr:NfeD family protein [Cryobacterium melibiosiphilum]RJT89248.1 NfeD family protein [Cryobacterium melibiosiphilum]
MVDLTAYLWIAWLVLILVFVIIELLSLEFTFLMLSIGSLGGLGANLIGLDWWLQIVVAAVLSMLLILTIRPFLLRAMRRGEDPARSNVDALIGMAGRVMSTINDAGGLVKLSNGETWSARLSPAAPLRVVEPGVPVSVAAIDGSIAIVTPSSVTSTDSSERTQPHA